MCISDWSSDVCSSDRAELARPVLPGTCPWSLAAWPPGGRMVGSAAMKTSDFDFDLPRALIAQRPIEPRDRARLLQVGPGDRGPDDSGLADRLVSDLPDLLRPCDQIGRSHVLTPVTYAHPVCRPLLSKNIISE